MLQKEFIRQQWRMWIETLLDLSQSLAAACLASSTNFFGGDNPSQPPQ
jgi:hypothetical protein